MINDKLPLTAKEKEELTQLKRRLLELSPIRIKLEAELEDVCREITSICKRKEQIDRQYIEIKVVRATAPKAKPITAEDILKSIKPGDIADLLAILQEKKEKENESRD